MKIYFISIFSPFLVFKHDFIRPLILPVSQLQTQQLMTSHIRSHIESLIHTCAHFVVEIDKKNLVLIAGFNTV